MIIINMINISGIISLLFCIIFTFWVTREAHDIIYFCALINSINFYWTYIMYKDIYHALGCNSQWEDVPLVKFSEEEITELDKKKFFYPY